MIRPYKNEDQHVLLAILRLNIPNFFAPSEEDDFIDYLQNFADNYYVVVLNDEILGCGGYNLSKDNQTAFISWDFFDPKAQGKGLGRELTSYRIAQIKKQYGNINIVVRTSQLVYKFYQKLGFVLKYVTEDYWAKGFHLYYMELKN